jgi:hypothetical protein
MLNIDTASDTISTEASVRLYLTNDCLNFALNFMELFSLKREYIRVTAIEHVLLFSQAIIYVGL